jgi:hypothetical protein
MAEHINRALALLRRLSSPARAVAALARRYHLSERQAHRYIQQAQKVKRPIEIPERKTVFTVKLPIGLLDRLRRFAQLTGDSLSVIVARALEAYLQRGGHGSD